MTGPTRTRNRNRRTPYAPVAALAGLALALAACAPRSQEVGPRLDAPRLDGDAIIAADGARLPLRSWLPEGDARAVVLGVHGFNDYGHGFAMPAAVWAEAGIAVYAYDQRGFGAGPAPGLWPGVDALVGDLAEAARVVGARHPGTPLYLVGESMGGGVVMTALARGLVPEAEGAVLVAPAVWGRQTMNAFYRAALWLAAHTVPWATVTGEGLDITPSDNEAMLRALSADPLVIKNTRIDSLWGVVDLMDSALAAAPAIETPLLVLYGARDEVIPEAPTQRMICALNGRRTVAVYPDGWHMLLRDLQAEVVDRDVIAWIEQRPRRLPSGADSNLARFADCGTAPDALRRGRRRAGGHAATGPRRPPPGSPHRRRRARRGRRR